MNVPFCKVTCRGNEYKYVKEVIESGWLTTAGKCFEFERKFSEVTGAKHAIAVNSATAGLHLAVEALGIKQGDCVLVPSLTFTATAEVVRYVGADPVFVDVEYGSCLVTAEIIEDALKRNNKIRAVMIVHFGGQGAKMGEICDICRKYGVKVIEDAAHAFPARVSGKNIGVWGDVTVFSFYANKTITTGEGGMLVTQDDTIAKRVRVMRLHGISRDVWDRFTSSKGGWEYDVIAPGFKYNMPDICAAVGLAQLEVAEKMRFRRSEVVTRYFEELSELESVDLPLVHCSKEDHAWHLFWLVLNEKTVMSRAQFIDQLQIRGIGFSVHYKPLYRMTYYRQKYKLSESDYPNSERHWAGCVSLPLYSDMSDEEVDYVTASIKEILGR